MAPKIPPDSPTLYAAKTPQARGFLAPPSKVRCYWLYAKERAAVLPHEHNSDARHVPQSIGIDLWYSFCLPRSRLVTAPLLADEIQDRELLERQVLRYVLEHPTAADSIEGVRLWWLRDAGVVNAAELQIVLDELSKRGWLVTRGDRPEMQIYGLNERERTAVEQFVAAAGDRFDG